MPPEHGVSGKGGDLRAGQSVGEDHFVATRVPGQKVQGVEARIAQVVRAALRAARAQRGLDEMTDVRPRQQGGETRGESDSNGAGARESLEKRLRAGCGEQADRQMRAEKIFGLEPERAHRQGHAESEPRGQRPAAAQKAVRGRERAGDGQRERKAEAGEAGEHRGRLLRAQRVVCAQGRVQQSDGGDVRGRGQRRGQRPEPQQAPAARPPHREQRGRERIKDDERIRMQERLRSQAQAAEPRGTRVAGGRAFVGEAHRRQHQRQGERIQRVPQQGPERVGVDDPRVDRSPAERQTPEDQRGERADAGGDPDEHGRGDGLERRKAQALQPSVKRFEEQEHSR